MLVVKKSCLRIDTSFVRLLVVRLLVVRLLVVRLKLVLPQFKKKSPRLDELFTIGSFFNYRSSQNWAIFLHGWAKFWGFFYKLIWSPCISESWFANLTIGHNRIEHAPFLVHCEVNLLKSTLGILRQNRSVCSVIEQSLKIVNGVQYNNGWQKCKSITKFCTV
jgi:hypothetical protein